MLTRCLRFAPIIALVLCATYASAALINVSYVFPDDVTAVLSEVAAHHDLQDDRGVGALDLTTGGYGGPQSSLILRLIIISLYLGGVPVSVIATVFAARTQRLDHHWSAGWSNVFLAGFAFQFSSLLLTTLLLYASVVAIRYAYDGPREAAFVILLEAGSVAANAIALWSWRVLRGAVVEEPNEFLILNS